MYTVYTNFSRLKYFQALCFLHVCEEWPWRSSSLQPSIWENNAKCCFSAWEYPSCDILRCSWGRGNAWCSTQQVFPMHIHLSNHACAALQNKQPPNWLHEDLFKTTVWFLTHQIPLWLGVPPPSWQRSCPCVPWESWPLFKHVHLACPNSHETAAFQSVCLKSDADVLSFCPHLRLPLL